MFDLYDFHFDIYLGLYRQTYGCDLEPLMECQNQFTQSLGLKPGDTQATAAFEIKTEEQLDRVCA